MPFENSETSLHKAMSQLSVEDQNSTLTIHYFCSHSVVFYPNAAPSHDPLPPGVKYVDAVCSECAKHHEAVHLGMTCNQFCTFLRQSRAVTSGDIRHTCGHVYGFSLLDVWVSADTIASTECAFCVSRREKNEQRMNEARQGFRRG